MKKKLTVIGLLVGQALLLPLSAYADKITQINTDLATIIQNVTNWILGIAGAIAVLFLIIGGVRYIISAGNPAQAEGAKKTIIYALVGVVIIALSIVLVNGVLMIVGGTS